MTKNPAWWLSLGFVAVASVACSGPPQTIEAAHCSGQECQIQVQVQDCAAGKFYVYPDPARIQSAKHIKWTIKTSGYTFTTNGIQISGSDFTNDPGSIGQGDMWRIHDAHTQLGQTKYTIEVKPTTGAPCSPLDPFIVNE